MSHTEQRKQSADVAREAALAAMREMRRLGLPAEKLHCLGTTIEAICLGAALNLREVPEAGGGPCDNSGEPVWRLTAAGRAELEPDKVAVIDRVDPNGDAWSGELHCGRVQSYDDLGAPCVDDLAEYGFEPQRDPEELPGLRPSPGPLDAGPSPAAPSGPREDLL